MSTLFESAPDLGGLQLGPILESNVLSHTIHGNQWTKITIIDTNAIKRRLLAAIIENVLDLKGTPLSLLLQCAFSSVLSTNKERRHVQHGNLKATERDDKVVKTE